MQGDGQDNPDPDPDVDAAHRRARMVQRQLAARGIRDERVLGAMRPVPRERFVAAGCAATPTRDSPLPIERRPDDLAAVHRRR